MVERPEGACAPDGHRRVAVDRGHRGTHLPQRYRHAFHGPQGQGCVAGQAGGGGATRERPHRQPHAGASIAMVQQLTSAARQARGGPGAPATHPIAHHTTRLGVLVEERAQLAVAVQQTRAEDDHGHDVGRERALMERAASAEGSVLTSDEREQVYAAIIRAARSAQRRQAAADAAAEAERVTAAGSVA